MLCLCGAFSIARRSLLQAACFKHKTQGLSSIIYAKWHGKGALLENNQIGILAPLSKILALYKRETNLNTAINTNGLKILQTTNTDILGISINNLRLCMFGFLHVWLYVGLALCV